MDDGVMEQDRQHQWLPADGEWRRNMSMQAGTAGFLFPAAFLLVLSVPTAAAIGAGLVVALAAVIRCWSTGLLLDHEHEMLTDRGFLRTRSYSYSSVQRVSDGGAPAFQGAMSEWGSAAVHVTIDGQSHALASTTTRSRDKALRKATYLTNALDPSSRDTNHWTAW